MTQIRRKPLIFEKWTLIVDAVSTDGSFSLTELLEAPSDAKELEAVTKSKILYRSCMNESKSYIIQYLDMNQTGLNSSTGSCTEHLCTFGLMDASLFKTAVSLRGNGCPLHCS